MEKKKLVKSISYNQQDIINDILNLHVPSKTIDADITYSKGNFYKSGLVKEPTFKFDLFPQTNDTIQADSRHLPVKDKSFDCVMFDPPFIATKGPSIKEGSNDYNNLILKHRPPFGHG